MVKKLSIFLSILILSTVSISASSQSIADSIKMVYPISGFIPYVTSFMVYLFLTVVYLYIVIMYEVNRKKSLAIATIIWLSALGALAYFFNSYTATDVTIWIAIISFMVIAFKSLLKSKQELQSE